MSATWNGAPMWSGRGSSILHAADAALARAGITGIGCGLRPERVRELMQQEERKRKIAKAVAPAKPAPARRTVEDIEARLAAVVQGWLAMPESARGIAKYATSIGMGPERLRRVLAEAGVIVRDARQVRIAERIARVKELESALPVADLASVLGVDKRTAETAKKSAALQVNPSARKRRGADVLSSAVSWPARPQGQRSLTWAMDGAAKCNSQGKLA
jgi:hypothetical protein